MLEKIDSFGFPEGETIGWKYEVLSRLGSGWEAEVYLLREIETGIERAGKFFFPHRNVKSKASRFYAKKLHKLRHCPTIIQYYTQETIYIEGNPVQFLVSDYVDGPILEDFIKGQPGSRLGVFQSLHLLHALAKGFEPIHMMKEYHGDLHTGNIIVHRYGLHFDLKVLDFFHYGASTREHVFEDVVEMIRIFFEALGGPKFYSKQPREVKEIVCGMKQSLIRKKFRHAGHLRAHLENMVWETPTR